MSKFVEKYNNDDDFKSKHLTYVMEKVKCPDCGKMYSRCNISHHKATKYHKASVKKNNDIIEQLTSLKSDMNNNDNNNNNNNNSNIDIEKFNKLMSDVDFIITTLQLKK